MAFKRGYKTWCERTSASVRRDLGLRPDDPLSAEDLATELGVHLLVPSEISDVSDASLRTLSQTHSDDWSAVTINAGGSDVIVYNPDHPPGRISNTLMHEMAHVMREHEPSPIVLFPKSNLALRWEYDDEQEQEANWLAGCLLLPRPALVSIKRRRLPSKTALDLYGASITLFKMRMNVTGVESQTKRWR